MMGTTCSTFYKTETSNIEASSSNSVVPLTHS